MTHDNLPASIVTIDCHYVSEKRAAAYLIIEGDRAAFVDNNTVFAVPRLLTALAEQGLRPEQVDYVIITHLHLDHAGGTAELMKHCPNATLLAHPKAVRHLADPSRLVQSVLAVYGEEDFSRLYGHIEPVDTERIHGVADGEVVLLGTRTLRFLHTLGHASHHVCIHDTAANAIFTGDSFGVGLNDAVRPGPGFLVCSAAPAEFDPEAARATVAQILGTSATAAYPTHFGPFPRIHEWAPKLLRSIGQMEAILQEGLAAPLEGDALIQHCRNRVAAAFDDHLAWCGVTNPEADHAWLEGDIKLNGFGLAMVAERMRRR